VRNDLQIFLVFDLTGDLLGGGSRIKDDRLTVVNQGCGGCPNSSFILSVKFCLNLQRRIDAYLSYFYGTPMSSAYQSALVQIFQVVTNGDFRSLKTTTEIHYRHLPVFLKKFQDLGPTFQ